MWCAGVCMRYVQCLVLLCSVGNVVGIVGGVVSPPSSSIVKIISPSRQCTGIVVGPLHVLTAAHCLTVLIAEIPLNTTVSPLVAAAVTVAQNTERRKEYIQDPLAVSHDCSGGVCRATAQITGYFFHPCYIIQNGSDFRNDLALLEISSSTPFRVDAQMRVDGVYGHTPAKDTLNMAIVSMSGYGEQETLSSVRVNLLPVAACIGRENPVESGITQESTLCVGGATPSSDNIDMRWGYACVGDVGGPVEVQSGDGPWTIGMVTTTTNFPTNNPSCTAPGRFVFATRLAPHGEWIKATMENRDWTCTENNENTQRTHARVVSNGTSHIRAAKFLITTMILVSLVICL
jgi:secreted trypsin-like serine protease